MNCFCELLYLHFFEIQTKTTPAVDFNKNFDIIRIDNLKKKGKCEVFLDLLDWSAFSKNTKNKNGAFSETLAHLCQLVVPYKKAMSQRGDAGKMYDVALKLFVARAPYYHTIHTECFCTTLSFLKIKSQQAHQKVPEFFTNRKKNCWKIGCWLTPFFEVVTVVVQFDEKVLLVFLFEDFVQESRENRIRIIESDFCNFKVSEHNKYCEFKSSQTQSVSAT